MSPVQESQVGPRTASDEEEAVSPPPGGSKRKRQRLRPETRSELLDRLRNPQLSLHEAAVLLRVCRATVRRYADSGALPHVRTSGGQRRFYLRDVEVFTLQASKKKV